MTRIARLARRPTEDYSSAAVTALSSLLRAPSGTQLLRPIQARSLAEAAACRGLFCAARVGAGKTLISGLAPTVLGAKRPLLLVPSALVRATERNFQALRRHWQVPEPYRIESYTRLGLRAHATLLDDFAPDLIVCDEAHKLKNVRTAGCARRLARYLAGHPVVRVVILSATPTRSALGDYAHLVVWALRQGAPVPLDPETIEVWGQILDEPRSSRSGWTTPPSAKILQPDLGSHIETQSQARSAFRRRLTETLGVVISSTAYEGVQLEVEPIRLVPPPALEEHFERLRKLWITPDDWLLPDKQLGVWGVAQQLALGFFYRHDPRPPEDWMAARRGWCAFCRRVLEASACYDTEAQVRDACLAGELPDHAWRDWAAVRGDHTPHTVATWLSQHAIAAAADWGRDGGIIWTSHTVFGQALSEATGWRYFGRKGLDTHGKFIEAATDATIIASVASNNTGRNLQRDCGPGGAGYCRNLFVTPPKASLDWEQQIGRTFRDLQTRDVTVDYFVGCLENWVALPCALGYASYTEETVNQQPVLLQGSVRVPPSDWLDGFAFGD